MARKLISTRMDEDLYNNLKTLSYKLSARGNRKVNLTDLIEEAVQDLVTRYADEEKKGGELKT